MNKLRKISESAKKAVAGRQFYKCANEPGSNLDKLQHYSCPLWEKSNVKTRGSFDESGYDIDHIKEFSVTGDNGIDNLQALCKNCHAVKTKVFLRSLTKAKKDSFDNDDMDIDDESIDDISDLNDDQSICIDSSDKNIACPKKDTKNIVKFECDKCNKVFSQKNNLKYHIEHNACKEYKYFCKHCNKGFTADGNMYRHMKHSCKVKKQKDEEREKIYNKILQLEEENKEIKQEMKNKYKEYKDEIDTIEKNIKRSIIKNINNGQIIHGDLNINVMDAENKIT